MMMESGSGPEPAPPSSNCCYLCNQCSSSFASLEELESHLAHHSADPESRARRADENSPSSSDTSFHIDDSQLDTSLPPPTPTPELEEPSLSHNVGPLSPLEDPAKRTYPCRFCNKLFSGRSLLNIHYTHTHRDKPQYECEDCGRIFSVKRELATHRRVHSGEATHACAQCGKEFGTRQLLKKHWMWHTGQRSHVCPHCGKAFFQKGHLTQHLMIHAGGRPHVCQLCNKTFIFKFDLNRHMKIHAERGYSCNKCGKAFLKEGTLIDHQAKCSGERTTNTSPSPASPARSMVRSVPSTPERKHSTASLGLKADTSPLSAQPLPLFPQMMPPTTEAAVPGQPQRIVCLLCMQDFPSQAAYSLHLSYVHLRDAMFNSFQQQQGDMKNPSPVVSMISALSQQHSNLLRQGSPIIRRASDSAVLSRPDPEPEVVEPKKEMEEEMERKEEEEETEGEEEEEEEEKPSLVEGCLGCGEAGPVLARAQTRVRELTATVRAKEAEVTKLRGKMQRVGLIAGSLLDSCSEFDKLWMLHSKKVYSQIQSVLNSLD